MQKIYIVFGIDYEAHEFDRVYKNKKMAEKRAERLNKEIPSMEDAEKVLSENETNWEDFINNVEQKAKKFGHNAFAYHFEWRVIGKKVY